MDQENTASIRLELLSAIPTHEQIIRLLSLAQEQKGTTVKIPWVDDETRLPFALSVCFATAGGAPKWVLKCGLGQHAVTVFAHHSGDVNLIHSLINQPVDPDIQAHSGTSFKQVDPVTQKLNEPRRLPPPEKLFKQRSKSELPTSNHRALSSSRVDTLASMPSDSERNSVFGHNVLVGDLLLSAGFLSPSQLAQALPIAKKTGLPVGRILEESGAVSQSTVRAAVLAQSLIRDKLLHLELGVSALKLVDERSISLEVALKALGWSSEYYEVANKLGELLIEAGAINEQQLKTAFEVCFASGLPLGRVLVLRKAVPEVVAYTALSAQVFLRDGKINRVSAVSAIRSAGNKNVSIQGTLQANTLTSSKSVRLGELLVLAGVVSEVDLVSAIEASLAYRSMIGQVLIKTGTITEQLLDSALKLQEAANTQRCTVAQATDALRNYKAGASNKRPAIEIERHQNDVETSLKKLGVVEGGEVKQILEKLLLERENLAFRLVSEHEEIKNRLARELHDTIIADLMMLKRYLSGDKKLSVQETIDIVDDVVRQLRDICNDFVPKHLQEWGLKTTLQDLVERVRLRTGIKCTFTCEPDLKNLPEAVHLHIFRIIQECFTNIEKYANAAHVSLHIERLEDKTLRFVVQDDGQGFDSDTKRQVGLSNDGGRGLHGMKERVQLIRCYFPTTLIVQSKPGQGSAIILEINPGN